VVVVWSNDFPSGKGSSFSKAPSLGNINGERETTSREYLELEKGSKHLHQKMDVLLFWGLEEEVRRKKKKKEW